MKTVVITFFLLMFCSNALAARYSKVELKDIQGLFGGQELVLKSGGDVVTRIVKPIKKKLFEKRYSGRVNFADIVRDLDLPQLELYKETIRDGMPDESRPTIRVSMTNGSVREYSKWDEESDEHFDRIYRKLLKIVRTKNGRLVYSGIYTGRSK
jgi:hypothetical protein